MTICVALLGGSFDPVHHGHVALAELFARELHPDELRIMPAGQPWQKKAGLQASDADRVAMLELAFAGAAFPVTVDTREIERHTPTYTVETLRELRAELGPDASIVFLMGADQLQKLDSWIDWKDLFALANFGVAARPGYALDAAALPPAVARELTPRLATPEEVRASKAGKVCLAHTLAVDISATEVRAALRENAPSKVSALLAPQVLDYIQQHNLYKS
ncbi:nicotinate-nucleotide adenylyltransferase [Massilia sp. WF1]|uniref:nicotinate-nucleotide adenylyltransferase n=1 Tax=unclassified Massilia TaxID=2609279 RepID=UPI00064B16F5|nr:MULTISPECIES: nicotinate-nucleotide adenylyltransferase [unclassified Massilia]ALK98742.1 nicotinate-nicotinamide nucleotide adenylyltransferase [Massilia sp. WG5]KLU38710.1 nicotinate-nucleotide adenylyltransferase [Massilia sp. WF1]